MHGVYPVEVLDLEYDEDPTEFEDADEVKDELTDDADDDGIEDVVWLERDEYAELGNNLGKRRRL